TLLLSMTGFGESCSQGEQLSATVEVRAVNNRYLKINTRFMEGIGGQEAKIDALVREHVKRGTVHVNIRLEHTNRTNAFRLNEDVLDGYCQQLEDFHDRHHMTEPVAVESLLGLPGVIDETNWRSASDELWSRVETALTAALQELSNMRRSEGTAMAVDLLSNVNTISEQVGQIETRAPSVVESYSRRLNERIVKLMAEHDIQTDSVDLIREVGMFAERCDISEEVVRLNSHIQQFRAAMDSGESAGRRLEFVTQEMFRETNTIGSKANDTEISKNVIEIKTAIERIREMVQNVE
ncbi:MAG: YicC family protein, partial [Planctomycetales bacterium]